MSATADEAASRAGDVALLIVRNGVTHDARVLRAATTLRHAGLQPLIVGVVTDEARERRSIQQGIPILRLQPRIPLRALARRLAAAGRPAAAPPPAPARAPDPAVPITATGTGTGSSPLPWRERLARLGVTAAYYRSAIGVVLRARPAVVHANDYNTMWVGVVAKYVLGSRLVYDAHELWPDRNGRWEARWWLLACEALFVRLADAVVTASPGYAACMGRRYRIPPPAVVRNIPEASTRHPPPAPPPQGPPRVVYVGGMLRGRGLEHTIDALVHVPDVRLALIGPGSAAYRRELRERAIGAGVSDRVELRDPVPPDELNDAMAGACLGLSIIQPVCLSYELTLPNKVFEYLAAGIPVLVSDLPVMAAFVAEHGVGEAVAPDDPVAIAQAIARLTAPPARAELAQRAATAARGLVWTREREGLLVAYGIDRWQASNRPS